MPEVDKGVMRPNLNTMPNDQQLSIEPDGNANKEYLESKRSNYHIVVPDDDDDKEEDVVFLGETLHSELSGPSKRPRVVEAPPPLGGSGVEVVVLIESDDEQTKPQDEANNADTTVPDLEKRIRKRDVSLVERFTEEEIKLHIKSLKEGSIQVTIVWHLSIVFCVSSQLFGY